MEHWAISAAGLDGEALNGRLMSHADKPARVDKAHSETAYMTSRAIDFLRETESDPRPWVLHLSYIKPHWPYIAPAPYHALYTDDDVLPAARWGVSILEGMSRLAEGRAQLRPRVDETSFETV